MNTQPRQPAGSAEGGQFRALGGAESSATLPTNAPPPTVVYTSTGPSHTTGAQLINLDRTKYGPSFDIDNDRLTQFLAHSYMLRNLGHTDDANTIERWTYACDQATAEAVATRAEQLAHDWADQPVVVVKDHTPTLVSGEADIIHLDQITMAAWVDKESLQEAHITRDTLTERGFTEQAEEVSTWITEESYNLACDTDDADTLRYLSSVATHPTVLRAIRDNPHTPSDVRQ